MPGEVVSRWLETVSLVDREPALDVHPVAGRCSATRTGRARA